MPQLTTTEWAVVAALFAAFIAALLYLRWRARRSVPFRSFKLHGPAVTDELDKVFGAYGQGGVEGLIVLNDGIRVGYFSGSSIRFVPVADGQTLYWQDGQLVVGHPVDEDD